MRPRCPAPGQAQADFLVLPCGMGYDLSAMRAVNVSRNPMCAFATGHVCSLARVVPPCLLGHPGRCGTHFERAILVGAY